MWFRMHPWVFPIIIGGIGVLYLIYNAGAIIETKKIQAKGADHHISGIRPVKTSCVGVGDAIVFIMLVIFSVAGFTGRNVILGYLAGVPAVLLFPYLTFKRPYFKADGRGILYRKPTSFGYGKAESIKWEQVEAIIAGDWIFSIDEDLGVISENKLNAQALSGLSAFAGYTEEEYEDQAEWIENGFFIVIKPMEEEKIELLDFGTFFHQKDFLKKTEMLRTLWSYHLK